MREQLSRVQQEINQRRQQRRQHIRSEDIKPGHDERRNARGVVRRKLGGYVCAQAGAHDVGGAAVRVVADELAEQVGRAVDAEGLQVEGGAVGGEIGHDDVVGVWFGGEVLADLVPFGAAREAAVDEEDGFGTGGVVGGEGEHFLFLLSFFFSSLYFFLLLSFFLCFSPFFLLFFSYGFLLRCRKWIQARSYSV